MKEDGQQLEGEHPWEASGKGKAPFTFEGSEVVEKGEKGILCEICQMPVRTFIRIRDARGQLLKVGAECLVKAEEGGAFRAYIASPEYRQRKIAAETARKAARASSGASLEQTGQRPVS